MSIRQIELEVLRYDPEQDQQPRFQNYSVPCEEDWAILDALTSRKILIPHSLTAGPAT